MRDKINPRSATVVAGLLLEGWALYVVGASPQHWRPSLIVKDEPAAHALYKTMMQTIQQARSLSYTSACSTPDDRSSAYRVWLKKPNSFHVEQTNDGSQKSTTLLDDGESLWIHWVGDRPTLLIDTEKSREDERSNVYVKKATLAAGSSIRNEVTLFGTALAGLILDPGIFHKGPDPLEDYIDGIRSRGVNPVRGEECDVIEVSFMKARRTRYLWLSRQDHLPRRLKEIDRDANIRVTVEEWSNVAVNAGIPPKILTWSPPKDWQPWDPPKPENSLLESGHEAPDFALRSARGGRVKLSDYRGQVVWLYLWDSGASQCREEIAGLQQLHQDYQDKGLAILGFNCTDDRRIARAFLRASGVTLPSVLDPSDTAAKLMRDGYGNRTKTVPLNYIIDREGKVVYGWFGHEQDPERVLAALKAAGLELAQ
jgi:peroxiredoxin/outer membrane lipoprotein-sorting protein